MTTNEGTRPVLIMHGRAYTFRNGCLLDCALMANGIALSHEGRDINWVQVRYVAVEPALQREIDRAFTTLLSFEDEAALVAEYERWCTAEGVPHVSADEHDLDSLTLEQRVYLNGFILRWELATRQEPLTREAFSHNAWLAGALVPVDQRHRTLG